MNKKLYFLYPSRPFSSAHVRSTCSLGSWYPTPYTRPRRKPGGFAASLAFADSSVTGLVGEAALIAYLSGDSSILRHGRQKSAQRALPVLVLGTNLRTPDGEPTL